MGKSESQMDIMEKSSKPGKRRWTTAEIGLSVLLLLVSCALAGLVVLYTSVVKGNGSVSITVERSSYILHMAAVMTRVFLAAIWH